MEEESTDELHQPIWNSTGDVRENRRTHEPYHHMNQSTRDENNGYALPYNPVFFLANSKTCNQLTTRPALRQPPSVPFLDTNLDNGSTKLLLLRDSLYARNCIVKGAGGAPCSRPVEPTDLLQRSPPSPLTAHLRACMDSRNKTNTPGSSMDLVSPRRHVFPSQFPCSNGTKLKQEEEERVRVGPVAKSAWIGFYGSCHRILLVGEGDFSFSASLAVTFGSATNMISTSLDSLGFLSNNYKRAVSNIHELKRRGSTVIHNCDATQMADYCSLKGMKFDRIVFNFPHAGFFPDEERDSQIRRHQTLVKFFFANAMKMISEEGEIHVAHKSNGFHREWNLQRLASLIGLRLIEEVPFNFTEYPGYHTKYGYGGDKNFNSKPSKTYKFGLKKKVIRWD